MTKLKDYIHYYFGCNFIANGMQYKIDRIDRLSDMTEEEAVCLAKLQHNPTRHKDIEVLYIKPEQLHYIDGTMWHGDGVSEYNEYFVSFSEMKADQFHYLLRQHFDLFNLIDNGLAVDAKTIEK